MQRIKIYDRVTFPLFLNLNDYLRGYEGITNKLYEKEVERMKKYCKSYIENNQKAEENRRK